MILHSLSQLKELKKSQYLSSSEQKTLQEGKLRKIVSHAYKYVPYYRNLFDRHGIKPADINTLSDLMKIPVTTKKDIQDLEQEEITAQGIDISKCVVKYTSGSTGNPLKMFLSPEERDFQILLNLRILIENGLKITDKVAYLINPYRFPKSKYWFQYAGILRREYLSVFDTPEKHAEILTEMDPDIIYGYPSNLVLLALYIKEKGIKKINPKAVFSVAEALEPKAKKLIDSIMHVDTCDILGTIELGDVAWQCGKRDGYHISADAVIAEFLKDGRPAEPGEEGRLVCTSLYGYTMPLIRYAVNDICVPSARSCSCGRTLPVIDSIKGRANDFIVLPDGRIIASCFLVIIMQAFHDVAQYRIVQENKAGLVVSLVKGKGFNHKTPENVKEEICKVTGKDFDVVVKTVEELSRDKSGKIRTVVSKVIHDIPEGISV